MKFVGVVGLGVVCSLLTFSLFPNVAQTLVAFNNQLVQFADVLHSLPKETTDSAQQWISLYDKELDALEKFLNQELPSGGAQIWRYADRITAMRQKLSTYDFEQKFGRRPLVPAISNMLAKTAIRMYNLSLKILEINTPEIHEKLRASTIHPEYHPSNQEQYFSFVDSYKGSLVVLSDFLEETANMLAGLAKKYSGKD